MIINNLVKPTSLPDGLEAEQSKILQYLETVRAYDLNTDPKLVVELPDSLEHVHTRLCEYIKFAQKIQSPDFLETIETIIINLRILHHEIVGVIAYFMDVPAEELINNELKIKSDELKSTLVKVSTDNLATKVTIIEAKCAWLIEKYRL